MRDKPNIAWITDEIADFLASCPSQKELLAYRPSIKIQERVNILLAKSKVGTLSSDDEWELNQFEHAEILVQAIKARLRPRRKATA